MNAPLDALAAARRPMPLCARWRPHGEAPASVMTSAIIAAPIDFQGSESVVLCPGVWRWTADGWQDEVSGAPLGHARYWWADEDEILAPFALPPAPAATPDEHRTEARLAVERLHALADNCDGSSLADSLRDAAVLLDEYQAGHYLATPSPRSGWVLVPATLVPEVATALRAEVELLERPELVYFPASPGEAQALLRQAESAIDAAHAALRLLAESQR